MLSVVFLTSSFGLGVAASKKHNSHLSMHEPNLTAKGAHYMEGGERSNVPYEKQFKCLCTVKRNWEKRTPHP